MLGDPEVEASISELASRLDIPVSSTAREIQRAEVAGLVTSRRVGNTKLVRANTDSPYFSGLQDVLTKSFGPPRVLAEVLADVEDICSAFIYGSWAARFAEQEGEKPIGDIDLLVLGTPDRDPLYRAVSDAERRLGRPIQVAVRPSDWLDTGTGTFHATVTGRPLVHLEVLPGEQPQPTGSAEASSAADG